MEDLDDERKRKRARKRARESESESRKERARERARESKSDAESERVSVCVREREREIESERERKRDKERLSDLRFRRRSLKMRVGTFVESSNGRPEGQERREKLEDLVEEGEGCADVVRGGLDDRECEQVDSDDGQEHGGLMV